MKREGVAEGGGDINENVIIWPEKARENENRREGRRRERKKKRKKTDNEESTAYRNNIGRKKYQHKAAWASSVIYRR